MYGIKYLYCVNLIVSVVLETTLPTAQIPQATLEIEVSQKIDGIEAGSTPNLLCRLSEPGQIWWQFKEKNVTTIKESEYRGRLDLMHSSRNDTGNYTCKALTNGGELLEKIIPIRIIGKLKK